MGALGGAAADRRPRRTPGAIDQDVAGRPARQPARQRPSARNRRISATLRPPFQHHPSNMTRAAPRKRQKSAILAPHRIRALVDQVEQLLEAAADPPGGAEPETFARHRPQHGPSGPIGDDQRSRCGISAPYFNRKPQNSAAFEAVDRAGCRLQPLCNRSATANRLIIHDIIGWLQSCSDLLAYMRARPRAQACARITRGHGPQLLQPARKPSNFNRMMVAAWLQRRCTCNRPPGPALPPGLACHNLGTSTGRGQTERQRRGDSDAGQGADPDGSGEQ